MAKKTLADFNYDYQAYADYLESPECANDEGFDTIADYKGNIYESDDWTKGHGHRNVYNGYKRDKNDPRSQGRDWKNPWLKYAEKLNLTTEEVEFLTTLYDYKQNNQVDELEENRTLSKRK